MITGIISSMISGVFNGSFAVPMKSIKNWKWENTWLIYALIAFGFLPIVTAVISVPGLIDIYAQAGNTVILKTLFTGFLFGIGSVSFGLGLYLAGLSLGNSVMIGITAVTGSLVPMLLLNPESIFTTGGFILLFAMLITVVGVIYCSIAGNLRAKAQENGSSSDERKAPFKVALTVCVISGIFSSMLNISMVMGLPIVDIAEANISGAFHSYRANTAVWAITLSGAIIPYFIYCTYLFIKNKSLKNYKKSISNFHRAALMGLLWFACITLYGIGASNLGKMGTTIGWLLLMCSTVIVGNLWGWITGEWKEAPHQAKKKMWIGLFILLVSCILVGIAKYFL